MARDRTNPKTQPGMDDDKLRQVVEDAPDVDITDAVPSGPISRKSVIRAELSYDKATELLEAERVKVREHVADLKRRDAAAQAKLEARGLELDAVADAQAVAKREFDERDRALTVREARVAARERDCDAGFEERHRQLEEDLVLAIEPLRGEIGELRAQRQKLQSEVKQLHITATSEHSRMLTECEDERARLIQEATKTADAIIASGHDAAEAARAAMEAQTLQQRSELAARDRLVRERTQGLAGRETLVKAREDDVSEREERVEQLVKERAQRAVAQAKDTARMIAEERDQLERDLRRVTEQLAGERQAARRAEGVDPSRVEELERENERLLEHVRSVKPADVAKLTRLTAELAEAQESAQRAAAEAETLRESLRAHRNLQADMRDSTAALQRAQSQRDTLHSEVERMREDLDLLRGATGSKSPDSELVAIDGDAEKNHAEGVPRLRQQLPELKDLVDETRRAMATLPDPRFYDEPVVRCFIAGLAASQLHIIQGISGTGKTSLPLAFATAIGAPSAVIEVQAAWRDRLDLVGHYSHLQRRYYATPFARAVYRSATDPWKTVPMFIVLDEMNLSHPEQYLADVLSALERPDGEHELELLQSDGTAAKLEDGRRVELGRHVWFIGTANRDETTKTIADKTYDRAHIMELPQTWESQAGATAPKQHGALPAAHLRRLFIEAADSHAADADWVAARIFDTRIQDLLARRRLGIGSRLRRQIKSFVPVYTASDGPRVLALDHLLVTKVVRKLDSVFDLRKQDVDELRKTILAVAGVTDMTELPATAAELTGQRERAE